MKRLVCIILTITMIFAAGCASTINTTPAADNRTGETTEVAKTEATEVATTIHEHSWEPVYKTITHPAVYSDPWDEPVLLKEAYDEQVLAGEAYDEPVLVKEAYWEQILVKEAWDETVHHEAVKEYTYFCYKCKEYYYRYFSSRSSLDADLSVKNWKESHRHPDYAGVKVQLYTHTVSEEYDEVVHHDAEYEYVLHDAEYTTVHHDAEYTTVHHNAEYTVTHHDSTLEKEAYTEEVIDFYTCSGCDATKPTESEEKESGSENNNTSEADTFVGYKTFLGAWYGEQGSWFILYDGGDGFYYDGGVAHFSSNLKWSFNENTNRFDLVLEDAGFYLYAYLGKAYQSPEMVVQIDRKQSGDDKVWYDETFDRNPNK